MKTIKYEFSDGTIQEIEVSGELAAIIASMAEHEKHNEKRETRRHISLNYLNSKGIDIEARGSNPLDSLIAQEEKAEFEILLATLPDEQQELLELFIDGKTIAEIAREQNLAYTTVHTKISRILKKLKKIF